MAEAPTLSQDEEDEVGEGVQNWVVISGNMRKRNGISSDVRVEPRNGGEGEPRHGAMNQREWGDTTEQCNQEERSGGGVRLAGLGSYSMGP